MIQAADGLQQEFLANAANPFRSPLSPNECGFEGIWNVHENWLEKDLGWATVYISKLQENEIVKFRPRGHSMKGKIESGQLVTVEPVSDYSSLKVGDVVLCKVNGNQSLHLIKSIKGQRFQIGNNRGRINGWIGASSIFGKCTKVEP